MSRLLAFPGWERFQSTLGKGEGQWVKLWREERGSFAQLPLIARGLFSEMLKLADEHGTIQLGSKTPWDAIAFALGADRADRRALKKYIPLLIEDGCVELQGDAEGDSTEPRTDNEATTTEQRSDHDGATNAPPSNHEVTTTEPRSDHEGEAKCAESLSAQSLLLNYKEEEEENTNTAREAPPDSKPDTNEGRWNHLDMSWRRRFGSGLGGLLNPKRAKIIERLRDSLPTRDDWDSEVFSFVEFIASGDFRPGSVWAYFAANAGDFRQKHAAVSRKANAGVAAVPDEHSRPEPDDIDEVFAPFERHLNSTGAA